MKCPHCQKEMDNVSPIEQLKIHIAMKTRLQELSIKKDLERLDPKANSEYFEKRKETLKKWMSWKIAIDELEKKAAEVTA